MGIVDVLAETGQGKRAVRDYIAANRSRHNAHSAVYQVRRRVNPVTLEELHNVAELWVDAALRLSDQDLRRMSRLVAAQDRARQRRMAECMAAAD